MNAEDAFGFRGSASPKISFLQEKSAKLDRSVVELKARLAEGEDLHRQAVEARTRIPELETEIARLENDLRQTERQSRELKAETERLGTDQARNDELVAAAEEFAAWYVGGPVSEKTRAAARRLLRA